MMRTTRGAFAALLLAGWITACGTGDQDSGRTTSKTDREPIRLEFRPVLAIEAYGTGTGETDAATRCDEPAGTTMDRAEGLRARPSQFSPTTTTVPSTTVDPNATDSTTPVTPTTIADPPEDLEVDAYLSDEDRTICYTLGPVGGTGDDLSSAEAVLQNGTWQVRVEADDDSRDQLNDLFDACYDAADTCPSSGPSRSGALAIVVDDVVISAPTVLALALADDEFVITGDFTEGEAIDLANDLDR